MTEPHGSNPEAVGGWERYPEYKDSGVAWLGEIPAHWEVRRLKECANARLSTVDKKSVEGDPEVRLCNYVDVYYNDLIHGEMEFMTATATPAQVRRFSLRQGDVLITKDSEAWTDIAVPALVIEDLADVVCGYHLALIRPRSNCLGAFFGRAIGAVGLQEQYHVAANGITRFGLTVDAIRNGILPLPPLSEQTAIAGFMDRETIKIDALIAKQQELIRLLQEKRSALISDAVTKGLDPDAALKDSGVEWLGKIPAHWEVVQLRRVALDRCDGPFGSGLKSTHYAEDGVRVVRLQNIGHGEFEGADAAFIPQEHYLKLGDHSVLPGDLLIAGLGDTNHPAGRACVAPADLGSAMVKADCFRFRLDQSRAQPQFLALQLSATASIASGLMSTGATRQRTSLASTAARAIAIPDLQEQSRIVDYVTRKIVWLDHAQHAVQSAIDHLNEYRTALISAAVTGKIDVRRALETDTAPNPVSP